MLRGLRKSLQRSQKQMLAAVLSFFEDHEEHEKIIKCRVTGNKTWVKHVSFKTKTQSTRIATHILPTNQKMFGNGTYVLGV